MTRLSAAAVMLMVAVVILIQTRPAVAASPGTLLIGPVFELKPAIARDNLQDPQQEEKSTQLNPPSLSNSLPSQIKLGDDIETGDDNPASQKPQVLATSSGVRARKLSQSELDLLARVVYSEARGEPYEGQVAVAAVVLNRVDDPRFPNTIAGVIYQPWAFTAVHDGQFYLPPNKTAYMAAQDAAAGWDPTGGALYYYNPAKTTSSWIYSRAVIRRIGSHIFAS